MYQPHTLGIALFMMITSAICWGSWANTYKGVKKLSLRIVLLGLCRRQFLISLIFDARWAARATMEPASSQHPCRRYQRHHSCHRRWRHLRPRETCAGRGDRYGGTGDCVSSVDRDCAGGRRNYELCPAAEGNAGLLAGGVICARLRERLPRDGKPPGDLESDQSSTKRVMRRPGVSQEELKAYFEAPSSTFDVAAPARCPAYIPH